MNIIFFKYNCFQVPPRALEDPEQRANEFFQPEPTLLDIGKHEKPLDYFGSVYLVSSSHWLN